MTLPAKYALFNQASEKNLNVVVSIAGVDLLTSAGTFKAVRYGDPSIHYGDPGLVYGGLIPVPGTRDILDLNSSSVQIQQTIEPEQGRGSVSQLSLSFIDLNGYMSQVVSPGILIPDILGAEVNVYLGYVQTSYPEDYFRIYRGYVTGVTTNAGFITLAISDPNVKRRQDIFIDTAVTGTLNGDITDSQTTITLTSTGTLYQQILGPNGQYDPGISTYLVIDSEVMQYGPTGILNSTQVLVTRAARGTTNVAHTSGTQVTTTIDFTDNAINLALKLMLSGFNGPWLKSEPIGALGTENIGAPGIIPNVLLLTDSKNADTDYGLTIGDYVTITGSPMGNNGTFTILNFVTVNGLPNNGILLSGANFTPESTTPAVMALRSKYDTFPVDAGARMTPRDVDVARHEFIRDTFLNATENQFDFYVTASENAKTFIESKVYLPLGTYAVTRLGRCSMGINQPPLAGQTLVILTPDNITQPTQIKQDRATNNRKFWNDIIFNYDFDDSGTATNVFEDFDASSFNQIGIRQTLPIDAPGARSAFNAGDLFQKRSNLMLTRFARGASQISLSVNWGVGNQIEAGDIIAIKDDGSLGITNFATGTRNMGFQLYEVINRTLIIKSAMCNLTLINGILSQASDRYGVIAPSSHVGPGSTTTQIQIVDSYGFPDPGDEIAKWTTYIGSHLLIHDPNFVTTYSTKLVGVDTINGKFLIVSPPVGAPPTTDMIVDFDNYSSSPADDVEPKLIHCFQSKDAVIQSGIDHFNFTVLSGDLPAFFIGAPVIVHSTDFVTESVETTVTNIVGTTITVKDDLGFTPSLGMIASLNGFADGRPAYRIL